MNRLRVGSWLPACILIAVLPLVGACAGGDKKSDAYAQEAWAYFKKLCDEKSGEKIYKTFVGVKSVLLVKPLSPATEKDLFDQYWYGDPYSGGQDDRAKASAVQLIGTLESRGIAATTSADRTGFQFVELIEVGATGKRYVKFTQPDPRQWAVRTEIDKPVSRFGISWEDISTPNDRRYWVASSRLRIVDLQNNSIVAERIGVLIEGGFGSTVGQRRPWLTSRGPSTTCPKVESSFYQDRYFIQKVLNPSEGN
jgi:hypothetical protein